MPVTLVHPAAVLLFLRTPLVPSALVAGAVAPDLPYYVSLQWIGGDYNLTLTHTASSVLWLDPLIALALLAVFHLVLVRPLLALLPPVAAGRAWPASQGFSWRGAAAAWIVPSVVVGSATHLAWDALGDVLGYGWSPRLNLVGGVVGAAALLWWLARWWRVTRPVPLPPGTVLPRGLRIAVVGLLGGLAVLAGGLGAGRYLPEVRESHRVQGTESIAAVVQDEARIFVADAGSALGPGVAVYAGVWHLGRPVAHRRRPQRVR
ncbi:DUF4184 family protein [Blastococcus xanthinilyticus]|uniref:Uncharacterized protein DUF4184 n=1 Tax=Blastococcus xanthinilyticus TaxID=1564164 RepID=A0A5S5CSQ3_9ACTN|nr:DUF4184 family protein [Blastococcus xanthinilyticus]TYP86831.1 uncharacterized protein DUF4184 [Blastococcus xanthinilyticus]